MTNATCVNTVASICAVIFSDGSELINLDDRYDIAISSPNIEPTSEELYGIDLKLSEMTAKKYGKAVDTVVWGIAPDWHSPFQPRINA